MADEIRRTMWNNGRYGQRRLVGTLMRLEEALEDIEDLDDDQINRSSWATVEEHWRAVESIRAESPSDQYSATTNSLFESLKDDLRFLGRRFDKQPHWRYRQG